MTDRMKVLLREVKRMLNGYTFPMVLRRDDIRKATGLHSIQQIRDDMDALEIEDYIGRVVLSRRATAYYDPSLCSREAALQWMVTRSMVGDGRGELRRRRDEEAETRAKQSTSEKA